MPNLTTSWTTPWFRTLRQLFDPAFLGVLLLSLALSACAFAVLGGFVGWGVLATLPTGWGWAAGPLGIVAGWLLAIWLFVPVAMVIAAMLIEPVARAVERRFYPLLPAPFGAGLVGQIWDGVALGGWVLLLNVAALAVVILLPGPGWFIGWGVAAWGIGRGLFVAVAMRRESRGAALLRYRRRRWVVMAHGLALAMMAAVPGLNLLVPVVGTAVMVHVLHDPLAS